MKPASPPVESDAAVGLSERDHLAAREFARLVAIMRRLRAPGGCPWDQEQTPESLRTYLLEETYEVMDALSGGDSRLADELGDLLLQIVFHAEMSREREDFDIVDVVRGINEKMIRRHPHVFGSAEADTADEVLVRWEQIKRAENTLEEGEDDPSVMAGLGFAFPALTTARKHQSRASRVGFDWPSAGPALRKVREEVDELATALHGDDRERTAEELGDLLFAVVNVARLADIDPEVALYEATRKFRRRFEEVERRALADGESLKHMSLEAMDEIWDRVKSGEMESPSGSERSAPSVR